MGYIHSAIEDAELTLRAAIKMLWLKSKHFANVSKYLCWYDKIQSREYDSLSLKRLDQILVDFNSIVKADNLNKGSENDEGMHVVEMCAGQGRNISTILKKLKPMKFTAVDYDKHCILEIEDRWRGFNKCEV